MGIIRLQILKGADANFEGYEFKFCTPKIRIFTFDFTAR